MRSALEPLQPTAIQNTVTPFSFIMD